MLRALVRRGGSGVAPAVDVCGKEETVLDFVIPDVVGEVLDRLDRSRTASAAYRAAWKRRQASGDAGSELLLEEMKGRSVPGAYAPLDDPRLAVPLALWHAGVEPRAARHSIRAGRFLD